MTIKLLQITAPNYFIKKIEQINTNSKIHEFEPLFYIAIV